VATSPCASSPLKILPIVMWEFSGKPNSLSYGWLTDRVLGPQDSKQQAHQTEEEALMDERLCYLIDY